MGRPTALHAAAPLTAALMISIALIAAPRAQQPPASPTPSPAPSPAASPAPKPLVPVAANSVAAHPDAYYGENVTLTAAVQQVLSKSAFTIEQRTAPSATKKPTSGAQDVLVLVPTIQGPVDLNAYVTVLGEVVRFDPAEISRKAKGYTLDLAPEIVEKYKGRPAVIATSVINAQMVDLAKRLPPPMTAEEEAFSRVMKRVAPAFAALRTGITSSSAEPTTQNAVILKQAFTETEAFWKARGKAEPAQWAQDARKHVEAIEKAAAIANWEAVKAPAAALGQACQTCHTAYRERFDDGSYRVKISGM